MVLGQRVVLRIFVNFAAIFVRIKSHKNVLVNLSISQEFIFQHTGITLESLKELPGLLLFISLYQLQVEPFISELLGNTKFVLHCIIVYGIVASAKSQDRLYKLTFN